MTISSPLLLIVSSLLLLLSRCDGFHSSFRQRLTTLSSLSAKKIKRSSLQDIVQDGGLSPSSRRANKKSSTVKKRKTQGKVSSDLANWAASQDDADEIVAEVDNDDEATPSVVGFKQFDTAPKESSPGGRVRQSERMENDSNRDKLSKRLVNELNSILEGKNNIDDILAATKELIQLDSVPLKSLIASKTRTPYRLAWVGSDDAICHVGTGLHKVPLARLQEIFLTLQGRNAVEMYEVISVLGPFPNVRNTLAGSGQAIGSGGGGSASTWRITWESVIDGAGKELAKKGGEAVDLQVLFCDENAILATVPPKDGNNNGDALENNGARVLLFTREDDLDGKLEGLRVI